MLTLLATAIMTLGGQDATPAVNWHENAFFGLHFDLHPNPGDKELGRETTYEHIRAELEKAKPDFVQYDCKGHSGWSGYPTKVGSPAPGIVNDALKVWRKVTKDMGIPLSIHYSGVWDTRALELHPDWARVDENGHPSKDNTCPLSGYQNELLIPQLVEVVKEYDIDGMWIDGENWASAPCFCDRCKTEFTKRTGVKEIPLKRSDANWSEWLAFQRKLFTEHVTNYTNAVHEVKKTCLVCSNWMYSVRMPEPVAAPIDYLSGDFDPSFGAERACAEARFISNRGKTWDLMAWTFLNTGGQGWTTKTTPHLCQEVSEVLAQGGAVFLYDQPQRSGRITGWHGDLFGQVAQFCRKRQAFTHNSQTIPQVALLHSETAYYKHNAPLFNFAAANEGMEGALHALLESGLSVDILNEDTLIKRMGDYPVVIVPDTDEFAPTVGAALREYVRKGGRLLASGTGAAAAFADVSGVTVEEGQIPSAFLPAGNGCVHTPGPYAKVKVASAKEIAPLLFQQDPEQVSGPAATINTVGEGRVALINGPVFTSYIKGHYPLLRQFIANVFDTLDTPGLIRMEGPWWIELSARKKDGRTLLQFVNRASSGYTSPNRHHVESVPDAGPFTVRVPMAEKPKRCFMAPDETGLNWAWKDGVLTAHVSGLGIHNVLVIE